MSKKKLENQNAPVFAEMNAKKHLGFINSHQVEDADPEDLCFCGEPISELGCGKIVCGEKKAEQAQFLPMPTFVCKIKH